MDVSGPRVDLVSLKILKRLVDNPLVTTPDHFNENKWEWMDRANDWMLGEVWKV